jgi:hypothetical protein
MTGKQGTYQFGESFQYRVAALILRDPTFLRDYQDVINPKYFEYPSITSIIRLGVDSYNKHNQVPTKDTLLKKLEDFCISFKINDTERSTYVEAIDRVYSIDLSDSEIVRDDVIRFGKDQALKSGILEAVELIGKPDKYDKIRDIFNKALTVGTNTNDLGINFFQNLNNIASIIKKTNSPENKIKTLIPLFDVMTQGGPSRKEIWAVMGLPAVGKTQFLVNLGAAAITQGFTVVHITIGDMTEEDIFVRYASRFTFISTDEVLRLSEGFLRRIDKFKQYTDRYLKIKYYPSATVTPETIRSYLSKLQTVDGVQLALVIVDYPDEFKPYCDDTYQNGGKQYSELSKITSDFNVLMWVASQVGRSNLKNPDDIVRMTNIADSWKKAMKVDGLCSLNQTIDEYKANLVRLWLDKVRRGSRFALIDLEVDYSMSTLVQYDKKKAKEDED